MFDIGLVELFIILIIATVFVGPERIPEIARTLGRLSRSIKSFFKEISEADPIREDENDRK